jgi:arylsulfatase A-like enzyme
MGKSRHLPLWGIIICATAALLPSQRAGAQGKKPNILVIMGDDIGWYNTSIYNRGDMGYQTPNIDRIGKEGGLFLSWYGQQSCTAGRAAFITGQSPIRTGLTKVGLPGAPQGLQPQDPTVAEVLKPLGYATGQFGKNHLGDRDEMLPTNHGFDEFFGNLYHLNAEEEPENSDYPKDPAESSTAGRLSTPQRSLGSHSQRSSVLEELFIPTLTGRSKTPAL